MVTQSQINVCEVNPEIVGRIFRNIEERNNKAIEEIKKEKEEFDEKTDKVIRFIQFQSKIDKIEAGYFLMTSEKERKEIFEITDSTREEIWQGVLTKTKGNKKKAISLIFGSSSEI